MAGKRRVWIYKYALTRGVFSMTAEVTDQGFADGRTSMVVCLCGWRGPQRGTLELAADDGAAHEVG